MTELKSLNLGNGEAYETGLHKLWLARK